MPYSFLVLQQTQEISGVEGTSSSHKDTRLIHLLSEALHPIQAWKKAAAHSGQGERQLLTW